MYMLTNVVLHPVEMFDQVIYVLYSYKIDDVVLVDLLVIFNELLWPAYKDCHFTFKILGGENVCSKLPAPVFLEPGKLPLTALHSFPGSGNTWVRVLLASLTGKQVPQGTLATIQRYLQGDCQTYYQMQKKI